MSAYEIVGPLDAPVVVVLGGISSSRHVTSSPENESPGWWELFVGGEKPVDTNRFRVLSMDYSTSEKRGEAVTTHDQARQLTGVLDSLGISRVRAIVGASYGGMVALAFAAIAPDRLENIVVIGAAHESAPLSTAMRILQRRIVELGIDMGRGRDALVIARGLAITTYSTAEHFGDRFSADDVELIGASLVAGGEDFARSCTPERFLSLSRSLDLHHVRPEDLRVPTTLISVKEDALVPVSQMRELAARMGGQCRFVELSSRHGHDSFLYAPELFAAATWQALSSSPVELS